MLVGQEPYKQTSCCAAIRHHIEHRTKAGRLIQVASGIAIERIEQATDAVQQATCAWMEVHVVETGDSENDAAISNDIGPEEKDILRRFAGSRVPRQCLRCLAVPSLHGWLPPLGLQFRRRLSSSSCSRHGEYVAMLIIRRPGLLQGIGGSSVSCALPRLPRRSPELPIIISLDGEEIRAFRGSRP